MELIRQEIDLGNGRTRIRYVSPEPIEVSKRANFPTPMVIGSFSEPVQSMADGKWYDSPAELSKSYKAANNPAGVDYIELGNEEYKPEPDKEPTRAEVREQVKEAIADYQNGWRPEVASIEL